MTFDEWWDNIGEKNFNWNGKIYVDDLKVAWDAATIAEREECAKICDSYTTEREENLADICADKIRERSGMVTG